MTVQEFIKSSTARLKNAGIGTARLDVLVLLEDCLNKNRTQLLAYLDTLLTDEQVSVLERKITRRAKHEPLAYIRGKTEFYGREFLVNKHVLEPRPESETMIDLLKSLRLKQPFSLADVGAGSGCLGITAKLELPDITVDMLELSEPAIEICKKNKQHLKVSISIYRSDLLSNAPRLYDVILANLPYVPDHYQINQAAAMEPRMAIFGGSDGLDIYRTLFLQLANLRTVQFVLTESLPFQHSAMRSIAKVSRFEVIGSSDFIQVFERSSTKT